MAGRSVLDEVAGLAVGLRALADEHRAAATGHALEPGYLSDADVEGALARLAALSELGPAGPPDQAVDDLAAMYGLSTFERTTLVAALAPDLSPDAAIVYGYLHDDVTAGALSVGLAFRLAGVPVWDADCRAALLPDAPIVRAGLVSVSPTGTFYRRAVVAADRVVQHLLGDDRLPAALERCVAPAVGVQHPLSVLVRNLFDADEWFVYVRSRSDGGEAVAVQALRDAGLEVLHVDLRRAGPALGEVTTAAAREAVLHRCALVIGPVDAIPAEQQTALEAVAAAPVPVVAYGQSGWDPRWAARPPVLVDVPGLDLAQRLAAWQAAVQAAGIDVDPSRAAATYQLAPADIVRGVRAAALHAQATGSAVDDRALAHGVRSQNAVTLEQLARRVVPRATAADLVLPDAAQRDLTELVAWVENRHRLIDEWGVRGQGTKGRGVAGLFVGSSGTGKTLAAEVVAGELGLDLYVVDLSTVVSKYIGETEENLERVFTEAGGVNGVLFFDEADAIFGKRTGVSDSKDRFANMEVAYLLQRMEQFDGVSLLASNLRANLDEAFTRRLDFVITFPDPGPAERQRIWDLHLPPSVPRADDVDLAELAERFGLAGGEIANVARAAGHSALRAGQPVGMLHLVQAVAREYAKVGRLVRADEFGSWMERLDR